MHQHLSDISREQYENIYETLELARKVDLYDVFCAMLYIFKSGYQRKILPLYISKKSVVYWYFQIWTEKRANGSNLVEDGLKKSDQ